MCRDCTERRVKAIDAHHSIEDFDEEPRIRKVPKRSKYCKKGKNREKCEPTIRKVKWSYTKRNDDGTPYESGYYVLACHRCGKEHGFHSFTMGRRLG